MVSVINNSDDVIVAIKKRIAFTAISWGQSSQRIGKPYLNTTTTHRDGYYCCSLFWVPRALLRTQIESRQAIISHN